VRVGEQARVVDPSRRANRRFVNKATTLAEQTEGLRVAGYPQGKSETINETISGTINEN